MCSRRLTENAGHEILQDMANIVTGCENDERPSDRRKSRIRL